MIPQETIAQIKAIPIEEVIGRYAEVKRNKACCPIHNEKTPSLSIKNNRFKCFGCGAGGTTIDFIKGMEQVDFIGAIEYLAPLFNIDIQYDRNYDAEAAKAQREERLSYDKIMRYAHQYFVQQLEQNEAAKNYFLEERGYPQDIIDEWQLGYAPANWQGLTKYYKEKGLLATAIKLSLVREKEDKPSHDFFFDKVMFPIMDERGQLVSFAGRVLDDRKPKYMNGSQSVLYNKSATLFGLYQAIDSIRQQDCAIVVEGYTDVISLHMAGATNTVSYNGGSLTADHARVLKRYTSNVLLMPDNDSEKEKNTGMQKVEQNMGLLLSEGFKVEVLPLPERTDPDDFAKQFINQSIVVA